MAIRRFDLEFTRDGRVFEHAQVDALLAGLAEGAADLIVLSHGWNNDMADARALYDRFLASLEAVRKTTGPDARAFAVCQVFWPSKKFTDEQLIPGGGAVATRARNDASLNSVLDELAHDPERLPRDAKAAAASRRKTSAVRRHLVEEAKRMVPRLNDARRREQFVWHLRALLDPTHASGDDGSDAFFTADPQTLFKDLDQPVSAPVPVKHGGAAAAGASGSAAGLSDLVDGVRAAARRLANYATYHQMKSRAGTVGSAGLASVLREVRRAQPALKLHLVGHSFGGRVVTAAADALDPNTPNVTITLLQAAYSHNGLAANYEPGKNGFFRSLVAEKRASGPILITHTKNDRAVGIAYPLASRIAHQKASALGDENDPYGGLGRNGAQHTPEAAGHAQELQPVGHEYSFARGTIYNLKADKFIKDHGDVAGPQVAAAFLAAARAI